MARALGKTADADAWAAVLNYSSPFFSKQWGVCGTRWSCTDSITSFASMLAPEPLYRDEWATATADEWIFNDAYGFWPPNRTWGSPPLATPLNDSSSGPWLSHTTGAAEAMEGLFRHNADRDAINLTQSHLGAMQRDFGYTVFPEAWDRAGGLWGDQWYLWGVPVGIRLPLERLAGVQLTRVGQEAGATAAGTLTVRDTAPEEWSAVHARIPEPDGSWIDVRLDRDATSKTIAVVNSTAGVLLLQPWLGGRTLVRADPPGYTVEGGRVSWRFVGAAARSARVHVVTA